MISARSEEKRIAGITKKLRVFSHIILSREDKTSESEVDTCCPDPHAEIFKIPDRDSEDSTEIIHDRYQIWSTSLRPWLEPSLLECRGICHSIDRYHDGEYIGIVGFDPPEYDEAYPRDEEKPIQPTCLYQMPLPSSYIDESSCTECREGDREWSKYLMSHDEFDRTDPEYHDPDKKGKWMWDNLSKRYASPVDTDTPGSDKKGEYAEYKFFLHDTESYRMKSW
jgi:hypothetical protein